MLKTGELCSTGGGAAPSSLSHQQFQQQDSKFDMMSMAFFPFVFSDDSQDDGTRREEGEGSPSHLSQDRTEGHVSSP